MPDQRPKRGFKTKYDCEIFEPKLSFKEARRLKGPIYRVLLQELYEESCPKTARHFECLVKKEASLMDVKAIRYRVSDEPDFLINFVENFILAEQSSRMSKSGSISVSLRLIYQNMLLLEAKRYRYDWLLEDLYDIVIKIISDVDGHCHDEVKTRLYYKFGKYLFTKGRRLEQSIKYLDRALELAKGERWITDVKLDRESYMWMCEAIAQTLAKSCLHHAKHILQKDPKNALKVSLHAVCVLFAVNTSQKKLLNKATLSQVSMMIECQQYAFALRLARQAQPLITRQTSSDTYRLQCKLFLYKGLCFYNLNDFENALESFYTGYGLCHKYKMADLQAHIQLSMGQIYARNSAQISCAMNFYKSAKAIYTEHNDYKKEIMITYLIAKIKMDMIFPELLELLKSTDVCSYYRLREWKNRCKPFWKEDERKTSSVTAWSGVRPSERYMGGRISRPGEKYKYSLRATEDKSAKSAARTDLLCLLADKS